MADEGIHKEPVSPLRAEPPLAPPDQMVVDDGARPSFPWTMGAAGAVWIVAGSLLLLVFPALLYAAWPWLLRVPTTILYPEQLAAIFVFQLLIFAALSGAAFLHAGIRIVREAVPRRPRKGLAVYSLVAGFLLICFALWAAWFLLDLARINFHPAFAGDSKLIPFAVLIVPVSPLLLTAGVLALAGGRRYELWRRAQERNRERGSVNTDNPFRK